jgi:two-component system, chemotaxis family, chemotaxis protein CheY
VSARARSLVLVVEDDPDLRELVQLALAEADFDVAEAGNGEEALAAMSARKPDLILLDMKMPVMDGWAFCRALGKTPAPPPVVVMTAAESPAERAEEVGASGWIAKPFNLEDLIVRVRRHLDGG